MKNAYYPHLFSKGKIGGCVIPNRVVLSPMDDTLGQASGEISPRAIEYYANKAKGGCGLVIVGYIAVVGPELGGIAMSGETQLRSLNDRHAMSILAERVHEYGGKLFCQLNHPGRKTTPEYNQGHSPVSATALPSQMVGKTAPCHELTIDEIHEIEEGFANGAEHAFKAGADGVEIHCGHHYLMCQFLNPVRNERTDEYGGSMENRCRFIVRILKGIREVVEPGFVVGARINGNDFVEGGNDQDACVEIAKYLEPYVDYFNVSCGVYASAATMIEPCYSPEGWRSGFVKAIKSQVSVPVIAVNTVKHPQFAEQLLEEGVSDFVGMSRMHIADPYLVQKTMAGREDLIRKCLGCMNCNKSVVAGRTLHCALNPVAGHEVTFGDDKLVKNGNGRKVAIVGGGPAGMQAALLMKKRGFEPVIFEASGTLGGSAILASKAPCKHMAQEFVDTQIAEMQEYGIEVHLNTPGTVARIQTLEPYCVVVACGGNQIIPGVPGADRDNVYYIEDVLLGKVQFAGKKIAVIGGGHVGLEVAHYLCADNQVTVVEMQKEVGTSIYRTAKYKLLSLLQENGVEILTQHALAGVGEGTVALKQLPGGETVSVDADIVVMALGNRPDKAYEDKLAAAFDKVIVVGDATKAGTMADATKAAYEKCFYI